MAHPLVDGRVTVLECVTPGTYWVKCCNCRGSSKVPESIRRKPHSGEYYPRKGARVFVRDPVNGFFFRGFVLGRRSVPDSPDWVYVVQRVDTFQIVDVSPGDVYPTFGEKSGSCEKAHLVSLHNLLPAVPPHQNSGDRWIQFDNLARKWDERVDDVNIILVDFDVMYYEHLCFIQECSYGNLTFDSSQKLALSHDLVLRKIGRLVSDGFESVVKALRSLVKMDGLLPTFDPYGSPWEERRSENGSVQNRLDHDLDSDSPESRVQDLDKFLVHEEDQALHSRMAKGYFVNVLLTKPPLKTDVVVRFIASDGTHVLGTVITLDVHFFTPTPTNAIFEDGRSERNMLTSWLRQQVRDKYEDVPPSDTESSTMYEEEPDVPKDDKKDGWFDYDFGFARQSFTAQGGTIDDYLDLSDRTVAPAAQFVDLALESVGISTLKDWQKVCLPSLLGKRNTLIIGPEGEGKLSLALVAIMSWLNSAKIGESKRLSPTVVVVVPDCARADYVTDMIELLGVTEVDVFICMSTFISEKQKADMSSSCDILVTNPKNFLQLMTDECFPQLGPNGLSHIVFDSMDSLQGRYEKYLKKIFEEINSSGTMSEAQRICLSHKWFKFLVYYIPAPSTRCVTDLVDASFSYNLLPVISQCSRDGWADQLMSTLQSNVAGKRLLLCRQMDVSAVQRCLKDVCRAVHGSLTTEEISKTVAWWEATPNALLISSDSVFEALDFARDVNVLISWKGVDTRSALIRRYRAISAHTLSLRAHRACVFLYYDPDNFEELVFFKKFVDNVAPLAAVNEELDRQLSVVSQIREKQKLKGLCPFMCSFGRCEGALTCLYRHAFSSEDTVLTADGTQFLVVKLVKIHSAFRFSVRVEKVVSNQGQNAQVESFTSNLSEIVAQLEECYARTQRSLTQSDVRVGDVKGARLLIGGIQNLRRVKIIKVDKECDVMFMDYDEPDARVPLVDLFRIPSRISSLRRDHVDIYLTGLAPFDFSCGWAHETRCIIELVERKLAKNSIFLAGPVNAQLNENLLVDSLRIFECRENTFVEALSLKNALLEKEVITRNDQHLDSLSALAVQCGKSPLVSNQRIDRFGFRYNLPKDYVQVVVSAFDDPGLFYVRLHDENDSLTQVENSLADRMSHSRTPLRVVAPYELCAVQTDGEWNRAIVLKLKGDEASVMCVDHGDVRDEPFSALFCLPDEFFSTPYFAVECELLGIKPVAATYCDGAVDTLKAFVRRDDDSMTTVCVQFGTVTFEPRVPRLYNCHGVVMQKSDKPDSSPLNIHFVVHGQATWDPATRHFLRH